MVFGIIPGFYDYETEIDPSWGSNLGTQRLLEEE